MRFVARIVTPDVPVDNSGGLGIKVKIYVVRGRHGELHATFDEDVAFTRWAESNNFDNYLDFLSEYEDEFEFSEGHWFLDEGGQVNLIDVE